MNLTKLTLKRPVSAVLVILAIVVFGALAMTTMSAELIPDIEMPMLMVMTTYPGADPESIEELISKPIEEGCASLSGVDSVTTMSMANVSIVAFAYDYDMNIDEAYADLRAALDMISAGLPEDASDATILSLSINALPTVMVAVKGEGDNIATYVEEEVVPALEKLSSIAQVETAGGTSNYIKVELNEAMMNQYGLSISSVAQFIAAMDFSIPAGSVTQGHTNMSVSSSGDIGTVANIRNIPIMTNNGTLLTLSDVAEVYMASEAAGSISRYSGDEAIVITATKRQASPTTLASRDVINTINRLQAENDAVTMTIAYDGAEIIHQAMKTVFQTLALGVVLTMAVLFLFFGDIKASLIVGSSMPLCVLLTLALMDLFNFSLNIVTAIALVIAIGMIVDSSIVVLESCTRYQEQGLGHKAAAYAGTRVVTASLIASTITTVVVYLPMIMLDGMTRQMFGEFSYVVAITMIGSLVSALTVVPLCFSKYKPVSKQNLPINKLLDKCYKAYDNFMPKLLNKSKMVMVFFVFLLIASAALALTLNMELIPNIDEGDISITANFRPGTRVEEIDEEFLFIEEMIANDPLFDSYTLSISGNSASITAYRVKGNKTPSADTVERYNALLANVTGMDIDVQASSSTSMMSSMMGGITISMESNDIDALRNGIIMAEEAVINAEIPGVLRVSSDASEAATTAKVVVDPLKAMSVGLTPAGISLELYYTLSGMEAATVTNRGDEYSIMLRYPEGSYDSINNLMNKTFATPSGSVVALNEIAHVEYEEEMQTRTRMDGRYQMSLTVNTTQASTFTAADAANAVIDELVLPEGVEVVTSVMDEMMNEEFALLFKSMATAFFMIFLVMAMQFESVRFSLMVMFSIPFSLIGSFLMLRLFNITLSMISLFGFLMMMGVVVNNGILLVDTANQLRKQLPVKQALIEAGKIRLRPILMTTLTTILAMLPTCFATGPAAMLRGMSVVMIGALVASTVLILVMLPNFYMMIDKKNSDDKYRRNDDELNDELLEELPPIIV
ncbi:MAG: efflux RND transporter permease subunit [Firmicutes bacterium]|nr:efflux RND transporter permease subunit [Bacillota bacterium]